MHLAHSFKLTDDHLWLQLIVNTNINDVSVSTCLCIVLAMIEHDRLPVIGVFA